MNDLIPLFQSLVWPLFFLLLIALFRGPAGEIFDVIKKRIEGGSQFSVNLGQGGFTVGEAPTLEPVVTDGGEAEMADPFESMAGRLGVEEEEDEAVLAARRRAALAASFHLVHAGRHDSAESESQGRPFYRVKVEIMSDKPERLTLLNKVVYHLHPQLPRPVREATSGANNFGIEFLTWGQFNLRAELYVRGESEPIVLERYLNV